MMAFANLQKVTQKTKDMEKKILLKTWKKIWFFWSTIDIYHISAGHIVIVLGLHFTFIDL